MRQADPGAGKPSFDIARRRLLQGGLAGTLLAAFGRRAGAEPPVIMPGMSYPGARVIRRTDPQGMPIFQGDAFGPMTFFVFPVAVAAGPQEIYIADAGLSALLRYDPALDAMMVVPGVQVSQQTRIAALQDGSVVVADSHLGIPRRYTRAGRPLQSIAPQNTGSRFDDIVVDAASGRFLALDRVQRRVEEVHPLGRSAAILAEDLLPRLPTAMALDGDTLYVAGQDCQCVVAVDLYRRQRQILVEDVPQVGALAAGDGWLAVADGGDRVLRLYRNQVLRADPDFASLRLVNPQGMSIFRNILYVADPGARRIATFRLRQ